jgi:hypothetical protein
VAERAAAGERRAELETCEHRGSVLLRPSLDNGLVRSRPRRGSRRQASITFMVDGLSCVRRKLFLVGSSAVIFCCDFEEKHTRQSL